MNEMNQGDQPPQRESIAIREYRAPGIVVTWEPARCRHAAECIRGLPQVFNRDVRPWIDASRASVDELVEVIDRCPSCALGYHAADGRIRTPSGERDTSAT
ncbi:(4Fe-4S)-binding protein [Arthrobacter sp. KNU40]|uniref:(4Fe-4S)-binding protein n=1 Tax=Arthrobacter sp. KNU40 TaxID=3447965 RepID=UPI003F62DC90